jgi:hypothetical protein
VKERTHRFRIVVKEEEVRRVKCIQSIKCLDEMVGLEDHMEEVVGLDVLVPTFVYTSICVEIKTNTERVVSRVFQKV